MFDRHDHELRARDNLKWAMTEPDVLPAWVADMDVRVPQVVTDRITAMLEAASGEVVGTL